MKRLSAALALTAATALSLTGCAMGSGPATQPAPSISESAQPTGSITVWSWDVAATALKRLATEYQASHPDTTVDVVDVGYDNAYDKISVGLQAGSGLPDLVTIETDRASGYLGEIACPVLLVVGRQDAWSPPAQHAEMLALLPDARLEVVEEAGHFAPVEQPDRVAALVAGFLGD